MHTRCGRAQIITPRLYFLYALSGVMEHIVIAIASDEPHMWRGHRKEAKRGWPGGYRLTRHCEALGGVSPPVRPQRVVPEGGVVLDRCTPWGQLWTPPVTLPHRRHAGGACSEWRCGIHAAGPPWAAQCTANDCATRCSMWPRSYPQLLAPRAMTSRHTGGIGTEMRCTAYLYRDCGNLSRRALPLKHGARLWHRSC